MAMILLDVSADNDAVIVHSGMGGTHVHDTFDEWFECAVRMRSTDQTQRVMVPAQ